MAFSAQAAALENEVAAYGEVADRICARIRVWPGAAPGETGMDRGRYMFDVDGKVWRRHDVSSPELVVLCPPSAVKPHDTLVVVMPGGGYQVQYMDIVRDFRPVLDSGRWVAVLHYRIPARAGRRFFDAPREDAQRAVRVLRARAGDWGVSREKIGVMGFSAGAHLAALCAVASQEKLYARIDAVDDLPAHVNFAIPVYPAYVADDGATGENLHGGDGARLLGEFTFDARTPPMFLIHGDRDAYSPIGSLLLYQELHRRKIPAQLFVYANAGHGLGDAVNVRTWRCQVPLWLDSMGF